MEDIKKHPYSGGKAGRPVKEQGIDVIIDTPINMTPKSLDTPDEKIEINQNDLKELHKEWNKDVHRALNHFENKALVSCLQNKRIKVKFIPREGGLINDPKHVGYGGMLETSKRRYCVPLTRSGQLVNVLTDSEKDYLEMAMGLAPNALSIYNKENNYWKNRSVELMKGDNYFDLSVPEEYIAYKILLSRKDDIAPSEEELRKGRKHTYQFVITTDETELGLSIEDLTSKAQAYKLFGAIDNDFEKLAYLCQKVAGKTIPKSNKELILDTINKSIIGTTKKFILEASNPYLDTEILISRAVEKGYINKFKNEYILADGNITLCAPDKTPSLLTACEFLNKPRNQEHLIGLMAKLG